MRKVLKIVTYGNPVAYGADKEERNLPYYNLHFLYAVPYLAEPELRIKNREIHKRERRK